MKTLIIETKEIGYNGLWDLRNRLNYFVKNNFEILYEGAVRLNCAIEEDCYAPRRVQINKTRLHAYMDLKYADGHKYDDDFPPTEGELRQTIADIQGLLDEASKEVPVPFKLTITETSQ